MQMLSQMPDKVAAGFKVVLTDIDDTLTTAGRLPAEAYCALECLHAAGLVVAPITGRPAGWCDMVARFWPVHGVVGENGALYFSYDESARKL
nr:HAD family hydrolase [Paracoccaceae bacterium]